ncbi:MAG: DNA primase [Hormoscilla sp.]
MSIPRLHPDTIEEVKQHVDIVDVISQRVVLRKRGKDFVGLCPFHEEKSPSFTVSPTKQFYHCFGCSASGNAITFLMELDKRSFSDVVLDLARSHQLQIKTMAPEERQELQRQITLQEQLYQVLALASSFYQHALNKSGVGEMALDYLKSHRQLSTQTIQQFQLGYAPPGWETLYNYLVEFKGYSVKLVELAGLILPRKNASGYYDRFRDRLIIPIRDIQGRIVGFGGRTLGDDKPKYLNSPETPVFDKGKTLFALDRAKNAIAKQDQAVVVEGYFDAIALHAAGITNVVASLGTALSATQVRQLLRYSASKRLVLNFDADAAGTTATQRAIGEVADLAYKGQVQLRILNLPDGKDADDFLKLSGSPEPYQQLLADAPLWIDWQIQQILKGKDLQKADQFQQVSKQTIALLRQIQDSTSRTYYINLCAQLLSSGDSRLVPKLAQDLLTQVKKPQRRADKQKSQQQQDKSLELPVSSDNQRLVQAEALLLRVYLHYPPYRSEIIQALTDKKLNFTRQQHSFLWSQIKLVQQSLELTSPDLLSKLQDHCLQFSQEMAQVQPLFYLDEKTQRDIRRTPLILQAAIACMERAICESRSRYCLERWTNTDRVRDPEGWHYYCQKLYQAKQRIKEIDRLRQTSLLDLVQLPWKGDV